MEFDREGIVPFLIASSAYLAYLFLPRLGISSTMWQEARGKLDAWRELEIRIESPDEDTKKWMAGGTFASITEPLLEQGFEHLGDYILRAGIQTRLTETSAPLPSPDVARATKQLRFVSTDASRAFEHKGYGCVAIATASTQRNQTESQVDLQIVSSGDGWVYTSISGEPSKVDVGQAARYLWSCHEVASVKELIDAHLSRRAEVSRTGGFTWGRAMTMAEIQRREENYAASVRDFARHHSPFSLWIWEYRMKHRANREWLGELQGKL